MKVFSNLKSSKNKVRSANEKGKCGFTADEVVESVQNWTKTLNSVFFFPDRTPFVVPKRSSGVSKPKPVAQNTFSGLCEHSKRIILVTKV